MEPDFARRAQLGRLDGGYQRFFLGRGEGVGHFVEIQTVCKRENVMLSLSKQLCRAVPTKRASCFDKLSMTFFRG
ncbi:hypothetical protein GCM10023172_25730 [Hymenobacter ginsengisoli]|uniref:Uncharacterized protein n=1 Tax=Hymenobacter ginsengisoli TaxID=1051626 RepID=A0ABP8QH59_9BACT